MGFRTSDYPIIKVNGLSSVSIQSIHICLTNRTNSGCCWIWRTPGNGCRSRCNEDKCWSFLYETLLVIGW